MEFSDGVNRSTNFPVKSLRGTLLVCSTRTEEAMPQKEFRRLLHGPFNQFVVCGAIVFAQSPESR